MSKIKTRRSPGTKILGVPRIKEIKNLWSKQKREKQIP